MSVRYLIAVTIMWAFSFSLIGEFLAGKIDSYFAVFIRVFLASLLFIPFTNFKNTFVRLKLYIMAIGGVQIGIMYLFYYNSFLYLSVPEVVLFTIFTPFYVTLIYDFLKKRFRFLYLISSATAILGAFIIRYHNINSEFIFGFLMIQGANFSFALGQSGYKMLIEKFKPKNEKELFGYFHFGALIIVSVAFLLFGNMEKIYPSSLEWGVLLWLGIVASGAGYFMWNRGACLVDAGTLAIMNNALIPAGLLVNLLIWDKPTNLLFLIIGSLVMLFSLWLHAFFIKKYEVIK